MTDIERSRSEIDNAIFIDYYKLGELLQTQSGPGSLFVSMDDAALDWGPTYNDNSIAAGREYASTIYEVTIKKVTYYPYTKLVLDLNMVQVEAIGV